MHSFCIACYNWFLKILFGCFIVSVYLFYHISKLKVVLRNKVVKPSQVHDSSPGFDRLIQVNLNQSNI